MKKNKVKLNFDFRINLLIICYIASVIFLLAYSNTLFGDLVKFGPLPIIIWAFLLTGVLIIVGVIFFDYCIIKKRVQRIYPKTLKQGSKELMDKRDNIENLKDELKDNVKKFAVISRLIPHILIIAMLLLQMATVYKLRESFKIPYLALLLVFAIITLLLILATANDRFHTVLPSELEINPWAYQNIAKLVNIAKDTMNFRGMTKLYVVDEINIGILYADKEYHIYIGAQLPSLLKEEELLSVLIHEFAHAINGDTFLSERSEKIFRRLKRIGTRFFTKNLQNYWSFINMEYNFVVSKQAENLADIAVKKTPYSQSFTNACAKITAISLINGLFIPTRALFSEKREPTHCFIFNTNMIIDTYELRKDEINEMLKRSLPFLYNTHPSFSERFSNMGVSDFIIDFTPDPSLSENAQKLLVQASKVYFSNYHQAIDATIKEKFTDPLERLRNLGVINTDSYIEALELSKNCDIWEIKVIDYDFSKDIDKLIEVAYDLFELRLIRIAEVYTDLLLSLNPESIYGNQIKYSILLDRNDRESYSYFKKIALKQSFSPTIIIDQYSRFVNFCGDVSFRDEFVTFCDDLRDRDEFMFQMTNRKRIKRKNVKQHVLNDIEKQALFDLSVRDNWNNLLCCDITYDGKVYPFLFVEVNCQSDFQMVQGRERLTMLSSHFYIVYEDSANKLLPTITGKKLRAAPFTRKSFRTFCGAFKLLNVRPIIYLTLFPLVFGLELFLLVYYSLTDSFGLVAAIVFLPLIYLGFVSGDYVRAGNFRTFDGTKKRAKIRKTYDEEDINILVYLLKQLGYYDYPVLDQQVYNTIPDDPNRIRLFRTLSQSLYLNVVITEKNRRYTIEYFLSKVINRSERESKISGYFMAVPHFRLLTDLALAIDKIKDYELKVK